MFIISKDKSGIDALEAFRKEIKTIHSFQSSIYEFKIGNYFLFWFSARPQDALIKYKNGFLIGKSNFLDDYVSKPIDRSQSTLPDTINPMLQSTFIEISNSNRITIKPNEITPIFHSKKFKTVSDFQLVIAKHHNLKPDEKLIQILTAIGYLPGNLSIFKDVTKIPYLHKLILNNGNLEMFEKFTPEKKDDKKMVDRLLEIIPKEVNSTISISGGMDSRFTLGLLLKKGIRPKMINMKGNESKIVKDLANDLKLKLELRKSEALHPYLYTLISDAKIYFRGGNYSQMIQDFDKSTINYNGLSILPINENSFASAWKKPGTKKTIYRDLIKLALIPRLPEMGYKSFNNPITKHEMLDYLDKELAFGQKYFNFKTRKQWGTWFYHINRGLTWTTAHLADLSFFTYPVFLLGDKKAAEIGISSTAYENFNKDRLRRINQSLFSKARIDYSDRRKFESLPPLVKDISKLYNEFFKKFFKRLNDLKKDPSSDKSSWFDNVELSQEPGFEDYYKLELNSIIKDSSINFNVKRTAVTINYALRFLNS